jgi:hypothetical protein
MLAVFARLSILRTLSFPYLLRTLTQLTDMDILILSCYDSEEIRLSMEQLRGQNNRVMLHLMEAGDGA